MTNAANSISDAQHKHSTVDTTSKRETDVAAPAAIYRMVMDEHVCPFGLKAKHLLEARGFAVEDHPLRTRAATDAFMEQHGVETTPQVFIDGRRIGGYEALRKYFGVQVQSDRETTYRPVIAVFAVTLLLGLAMAWAAEGTIWTMRSIELFVAFSMCVLAILKLRDLESFSIQFLGYDLLAQRYVPYAYLYPFGEAFAGIGMAAGILTVLTAPVALFIGSVGAASVFKAVYIDKRSLKCACVGGGSNVPLGAISLTENLMMVAMAIWMVLK